jgi:hypothetical protein
LHDVGKVGGARVPKRPAHRRIAVIAAAPNLDPAISPADLDDFRAACPDFDIAAVADLRAREYARLDVGGHVYLDYTGGGLYAESQLLRHQELLRAGVFGNPHSTNPTSLAATDLAERARAAILAFCGADPAEYAVVFTPNASGALKLVGEAYPFGPGDQAADPGRVAEQLVAG